VDLRSRLPGCFDEGVHGLHMIGPDLLMHRRSGCAGGSPK
jgi:hypothetical protein